VIPSTAASLARSGRAAGTRPPSHASQDQDVR
jgi:hypothetical protein